jgi:hypothetical protein
MSSQLSEFEQLSREPSAGAVREFWQFIVENKSWWMIPILAVFGTFGVLISLGGTGVLPFIYSVF